MAIQDDDMRPNPKDAEHWMAAGNCRSSHTEQFFPNDGASDKQLKKICADCPIKAECLEHALSNKIRHGVWGGETERSRRRIRRQRALARATAA